LNSSSAGITASSSRRTRSGFLSRRFIDISISPFARSLIANLYS
jgi:hypothetical protein